VDLLKSIAVQLGNVLQQKQIEAALRDAEIRYRSIFENAIEGIFQTSEAGHYLAVNPSLAKIYGFESSQELIKSLEDISRQLYVQPERRQEFIRLMESEGSVCQFESQVYRKDGEIIWISETARSVKDEAGNLMYYEGTVEDITTRKQAEDSLRKSEAKNRALLNLIPDTIIRLNTQGYCLDFIPSTVELSDLIIGNPETIVGQQIDQFLPLEAVVGLKSHITDRLEKGKVSVFEYQTVSAQGEQQDYEVRVVVSDLEEVLVIIRDITDRKKMERLKNEFVSMVSHELRTPLTSVKGSLGLIMGGAVGEVSPQVKSLVDIALKNSERLILIINDILDIEKIESGKMDFKMQHLDLLSLVEQAILANQGYAEQFKIAYVLDRQCADIQVHGDSDRLNQVLLNLLSNAAKFSPPESTVKISIETPRSGWVRVSVQDQGPGIPESFRSRIFQKFAQADSSDTRKKGGTGLGLSISKAIVERHQGHIGFDCPESGGTTFYFELPHIVHPVSLPATVHPPSVRVLICEDDPDIANLLSLMLREGGMASDIAYTAAEAKTKLASGHYVAMTLDLALPGQDGISLIQELRQQEATAALPIVVVSAKAQQGRENLSGSSFKVIDWLDKPIDQNRLMLSLNQALHKRSNLRPRILHVENDEDILKIVAAILNDTVDIVQAQNVEEAQEKLKYEDFDLVVLDLDLPDGSGLELIPTLYNSMGRPIPVVIFSAQDVTTNSIHQVAATLVKSRTSNQGLLDTITSLISTAH
jgi:PAS domain S-box-containing protein